MKLLFSLCLAILLFVWTQPVSAEIVRCDKHDNCYTDTVNPCDTEALEFARARDAKNIYGSTTKGPYYYDSVGELRARKLARGVANIVLCVGEIPNQMLIEAYRTSPVSGGFMGIFKGAWKGMKRFAIGLWEVSTFYFPGANYYQPYIEPEVVFQEHLH